MGGKHGKYVYIRVSENSYIKARRFKKRGEDDPEKYIITGPWVKTPPSTYEVVDVNELPFELRVKLGVERVEGEEKGEPRAEEAGEETGEKV